MEPILDDDSAERFGGRASWWARLVDLEVSGHARIHVHNQAVILLTYDCSQEEFQILSGVVSAPSLDAQSAGAAVSTANGRCILRVGNNWKVRMDR